MIEINGVNLRSKGIIVEKGVKDVFLALPESKEYLTESVREYDGDTIVFHNPKLSSREVEISFILTAETENELWKLRDWFLSFLHGSVLRFKLVDINRIYSLIYVSSDSTRKSLVSTLKSHLSINVTFVEANPQDVRRDVYLADENGNFIVSEDFLIRCQEQI